MVAFAMTAIVACEPENEGPENPSNGNNYNVEMFVGTWQVESMTVDGQDMTPQNMLFTMNEDGTGLANDNGVTENNGFTWSAGARYQRLPDEFTPKYGISAVADRDNNLFVFGGFDESGNYVTDFYKGRARQVDFQK